MVKNCDLGLENAALGLENAALGFPFDLVPCSVSF